MPNWLDSWQEEIGERDLENHIHRYNDEENCIKEGLECEGGYERILESEDGFATWYLPDDNYAIPSSLERNSASTVMPPDNFFYPSGEDHCYIHEAEVILEAQMTLWNRSLGGASEMSHVAYPDPLLIEMERIEKVNEEALELHEQKRLQLESDYEKEF
ncbi:hypothetical protein VNO77_18262 [Canavalia gladiata]|uniref:Uncharacterized protein n=1 Tax=Canavalia gladiata TaxID=3824 RepID=A0AAN9LKI1_CANGL